MPVLSFPLWLFFVSDNLPSLTALRDLYFSCLLLSSITVAIGVALEGPEVIHETRTILLHIQGKGPSWITLVALIGWILVAVGVIGEGIFEALVSQTDTRIAVLNDKRLAGTTTEAGDAKTSASLAKQAADGAVIASGTAKTEAKGAVALARSARQEADAFEGRIVSATDIATKAESHLAEALRRTAEAETALERVKAPRSLTDIPGLLSAMERFRGTSYTFINAFADEDSARLLTLIDEVLQQAGWNRVITPAIGTPSFDVSVRGNVRLTVLGALTNGVRISVDIPVDIDVLRANPKENNPMFINAAEALDIALFASIFPPEGDLKNPPQVATTKGPSQVVRISVGRKP